MDTKPTNGLSTKVIPNLMPGQLEPFNGDTFATEEVLKIKKIYVIDKVIETGTCLGGTTVWFIQNFDFVCSIESNPSFQEIAIERCAEAHLSFEKKVVLFRLGDSGKILGDVISTTKAGDDTLFFLDAHWGPSCPLLEELAAIADAKLRPLIMIHDVYVPGKDFQYDTYNGQRFDYEWVKDSLDKIYGEEEYVVRYNTEASGARVGIMFVIPLN